MHIYITFDPVKDAVNRARHGVSLYVAREIAWEDAVCWDDLRHDYGEVREVGLGPLQGRTFCVVFTRRNDTLRIISLRRANDREKDQYERSMVELRAGLAGGRSSDPTGDSDGPRHIRPFRPEHRTQTLPPVED
jgi:uncharacterized protein